MRNTDSGAKVAASYPTVRLVYGSLDDAAILTEEAARADIVLRMLFVVDHSIADMRLDTADSSDHAGAAQALTAGLAKHSADTPGYYIHLSGTGILMWYDAEHERYGQPPSSEQPLYNDYEDVDQLTSLPDTAFHRDVDKIVLAASRSSPNVRCAIACPPTIFGIARGPHNVRSRQINGLIRKTLRDGKAPIVGNGLTEWDNVHVFDLSRFWILLVEQAVQTGSGPVNPDIWGPKAYYFVAAGRHRWSDIARKVARIARDKGLIRTEATQRIDVLEARTSGDISWGLNSRGEARRARKVLGWSPSAPTLDETLPQEVDAEARELGLTKGQGELVAEASV